MSLRKRFFDFVEDSHREHGMGTALREGVHAQFEDTAPRSHLGGSMPNLRNRFFDFVEVSHRHLGHGLALHMQGRRSDP